VGDGDVGVNIFGCCCWCCEVDVKVVLKVNGAGEEAILTKLGD
jgi:hypothetical protein